MIAKPILISIAFVITALYADIDIDLQKLKNSRADVSFMKKYDLNESQKRDAKRSLSKIIAKTEVDNEIVNDFKQIQFEKEFERQFAQFLEFLKIDGSQFSEKEIEEFKKKMHEALNPKKYPTFLYLFSTNMPTNTVHNVFAQLELLKSYFPDIRYSGVVRGINIKNFGKKLGEYVDFRDENNSVMVHPMIFSKVGADVVPAFVYAECPAKFRFKKCNFKYVMFGDTSLLYFLEILSDTDNSFAKYYETIKEAGLSTTPP